MIITAFAFAFTLQAGTAATDRWEEQPTPATDRQEALQARPARPRDQSVWQRRIIEDYPSEALREEAQGTVGVALTIASDGVPSQCRVTQSSGHAVLDETACASMLRNARFDPALDDRGQPTTGSWSTRVVYAINSYDYERFPIAPAADAKDVPRPLNLADIGQRLTRQLPVDVLRAQDSLTLSVSLEVGANGRVNQCAVDSANPEWVIEATCRTMLRYARFIPAIGPSGDPVAASFHTRVVITLPEPPVTEAGT